MKHEWQRLGDVLFTPLEPLLDGVKYVYFLPHGYIHNLPLHALTIRGTPFIKRWGVAYAPSISVLESTLSRPKRQGPVLVMGYADPNDPRKTVTKFILEEAKKIATFFRSPYVLPEAVNAQTLRKEGQPASVIHLACHGEFMNEDPLNSGIVLSDGRFTARDWLQLRLQADLVTLSACQVGISDIRPGDDLVGLTRSILFAGASSLLMSLWSVDSEKTYDWMLLFYQNLQKNDGPARKIDAFKNATLARLEANEDPYYWAPFVLIGHA
ncbi:MAG TPA: CHAT domain-containing protein [Ktedonobacteraceae bacterium]|nr:CHAT domain-containing protein [Ktedonobacteraceae bacterium]